MTLLRDDGRNQSFRIVGEDQADPAKGLISHVSPLARTMFGKAVGDVVRAGRGEAEIIRIASGDATLMFSRTSTLGQRGVKVGFGRQRLKYLLFDFDAGDP